MAAESRSNRRRILTAIPVLIVALGLFLMYVVGPCLERQKPRVHTSRPPAVAATGTFTGWRQNGTGRVPEARPPTHWSTTENILWKTPMPAAGNATPVLAGDLIVVTAEPNIILGVGRDGQVRWQHTVNVVDALTGPEKEKAARLVTDADKAKEELKSVAPDVEKLRRIARSAEAPADAASRLKAREAEETKLKETVSLAAVYLPPTRFQVGTASSTPVTDGHSIFALFGNFVLASFDLEGKVRWFRLVHVPEDRRRVLSRGGEGQAASLLLVDGRLIAPLAYMRAYDPSNGDTLWEADEFFEFGTPAVTTIGHQSVLLTPEGRVLRVSDGVTLAEGIGDLVYASPMVNEDVVYFVGDHYASPLPGYASAVRLPSTITAPLQTTRLWERSLGIEDLYGSPLFLNGHVLTVDRKEIMTVLDARTGATLQKRPLLDPAAETWASPALAGGHIYVLDEAGTGTVLKAEYPYDIVAQNKLEGGGNASPVFDGDRIYIRSQESLYCIAEKKQ
jgi:hypothetical protein